MIHFTSDVAYLLSLSIGKRNDGLIATAVPVYSDLEVALVAKRWLDGALSKSGWIIATPLSKFAVDYFPSGVDRNATFDAGGMKAVLVLSLAQFTARHNAALCC